MKKNLVFLMFAAFVGTFLTSCKKEYLTVNNINTPETGNLKLDAVYGMGMSTQAGYNQKVLSGVIKNSLNEDVVIETIEVSITSNVAMKLDRVLSFTEGELGVVGISNLGPANFPGESNLLGNFYETPRPEITSNGSVILSLNIWVNKLRAARALCVSPDCVYSMSMSINTSSTVFGLPSFIV